MLLDLSVFLLSDVALRFQEGMTWLFDNCGGHGDTYGHLRLLVLRILCM